MRPLGPVSSPLLLLVMVPAACIAPSRSGARGASESPDSPEANAATDDRPLSADGGLAARTFPWPGSARAAVSLTYDDGLASHIEVVGPALEKHHLRGTFFITGH